MRNYLFFLILLIAIACNHKAKPKILDCNSLRKPIEATFSKAIGEINPPAGFKRVVSEKASFASWLRLIPLKNDKRVFLYNGLLKPNQSAQYAVADIPVTNKDLQCADVIMKLRAEYLFLNKKYAEKTMA